MKGAFFLGMVVLIWVGAAALIQIIYSSPETEFNKPLFLTYFSTSFFTIYLIPFAIKFAYLAIAKRREDKNRINFNSTTSTDHQN